MTESELRTLPRKLAERLGLSTSKTAKAEAVIREAIEQTLEKVEEAVYHAMYDDRGPMDLRDAKALKDALAAIRSLKPAKSGMEVKK